MKTIGGRSVSDEVWVRDLAETGPGEMQKGVLVALLLILDELREQGKPEEIMKAVKSKRKYTKKAKPKKVVVLAKQGKAFGEPFIGESGDTKLTEKPTVSSLIPSYPYPKQVSLKKKLTKELKKRKK